MVACGPHSPVDASAWARLDAHARASTFKVVCMGSTPGTQTVPRAELAAVCWVAKWIASDAQVDPGGELTLDNLQKVKKWLPYGLQRWASKQSMPFGVQLAT